VSIEAPGRTSLIIVSDFVCPWCYVGLREVETLMQRHDLAVRFAPYLLDPSTPPEGKPRKPQTSPDSPPSALELRGESLGITFSRGRTFTSNSMLAHQAQEFAAEYEESHPGMDPLAFHRLMFKAYFTDLEDVGTIDTVVRIGGQAGLPEAELREALESRRYEQQVEDGLGWARAVGVTAVPTFVFAEQLGVVGAQDQAVFEQALAQVKR